MAEPTVPKVWLYLANPGDPDAPDQIRLLEEEEKVHWRANPNTHAGDIVLMYRRDPYTDLAYIFRAIDDPDLRTEDGAEMPWIWLSDKIALDNPITLAEMIVEPGLQGWSVVRARSPQGVMSRKKDLLEEGFYPQLRQLILKKNPEALPRLQDLEGPLIPEDVRELERQLQGRESLDDGQIVLLPSDRYWEWERAAAEFALNFGLDLTPSPETAGSFAERGRVVTVAGSKKAFGKDIPAWFRDRYDRGTIDLIEVDTPDALGEHLEGRLKRGERVGKSPLLLTGEEYTRKVEPLPSVESSSADEMVKRHGEAEDPYGIVIWNLDSYRPSPILGGHRGSVGALAVTPDGVRLLSGAADGTIRVFEIRDAKPITTFDGHSGPVHALALASEGKFLVSGGQDGIKVWDLPEGRIVRTLGESTAAVRTLAVTPDGDRVFAGYEDGRVLPWRLSGGRLRRSLDLQIMRVTCLAVLSDGDRAVVGTDYGSIHWWIARNLNKHPSRRPFLAHDGGVRDLLVTPDGKRLITGGDDNLVKVWDIAEEPTPRDAGQLILTLEGHAAAVTGLALHPDGNRLLSTSLDGSLKLWDLERGGLLHDLDSQRAPIKSIALTPDGTLAITGLGDLVDPWEVQQDWTGSLLKRITDPDVAVRSEALEAIDGLLRNADVLASQRKPLADLLWEPFDTRVDYPYKAVRRKALILLHQLSDMDENTFALIRDSLANRSDLHDQIAEAIDDPSIADNHRRWLTETLEVVGFEPPGPAPDGRKPSAERPRVRPSETTPQVRRSPVAGTASAERPRVQPSETATREVVVRERFLRPEPTEGTVRLEVSADEVVVRFGGHRPYRSPLHLDDTALNNAPSPKLYGETLFRAVFHDTASRGAGRRHTRRGYDEAFQALKDPRFELTIDARDPSLHAHKWEYLRDPNAERPLASSPFYRLWGATDKRPVHVDQLKILVAIFNPVTLRGNATEVNPEVNRHVAPLFELPVLQEIAIVEGALDPLKKAGVLRYKILANETGKAVTLEAVHKELKNGYHVLHILAHGVDINGKYYLVLEDENRCHDLAPAEKLQKTWLGEDLRLVVMAACQSASPNIGGALKGLAPRLVETGMPAVIAMQDKVQIDTAQHFSQVFYHELIRADSVDGAMAKTRAELYRAYEKQWKWGIPVLFMGTDDGRLFLMDKAKTAKIDDPKPEIKTYDELPGADPEPGRLARALESEAAASGAGPELLSALRAVVAPRLASLTPRVEVKPLAVPQDRDALTACLQKPVQVIAADLKAYVEKKGSRLKLPAAVYERTAAALNTGKHVILIGPPGTGKTSLAQDICRFASQGGRSFSNGLTPTTASADWTTFDTVGGYVPTEGQTLQFKPGIFLQAICDGSWLVIDEINRAEIDKAFGELFTLLSGQQVDLPYTVGEAQVRVLPPASEDPRRWIPAAVRSDYDYVMHPNWRIIGTMNVYDKSSLFAMSFAFMRRFAFVDVDLPDRRTYRGLIRKWHTENGLPQNVKRNQTLASVIFDLLKEDTPLMTRRALGPAISKDMIEYIGDRHAQDPPKDLIDLLAESFLLYAVPQLDGLDHDGIIEIYQHLKGFFEERPERDDILERIRALYPHIHLSEWDKASTSVEEGQ